MTDTLRDRLEKLIYQELDTPNQLDKHLAQAIITNLGLREEWGSLNEDDGGFLADTREELKPWDGETIKKRYITDWEPDE